MKKVLLLLFVLVISYGIWWYLAEDRQLQFGAQAEPVKNNYLFIAYGYIITLIGVVIGSAYRELQKMKEAGKTQIGKPGIFLKKIFLSIDLWMGLIGSPIVYALIWKSLDSSNVAGLTVIALQNGFCCTLIASNLLGRQTNSTDNDN